MIRKENYKSDLELEVILTLGGVEIPVPEHDFMLVFFTSGKKTYKCRHKGDSWDNCKVVDGRLRCYLDNHGLSAGTLQVEYYDYIPDTDFKDGNQLKVVPRPLDIELIYGAGDDATQITVEVATDITEAIVRANAISADLEHKVATDYYRGVGVESIEQTTTSLVDAGENIITCTLTNGEVSTFSVHNGGMNMNNYYTREQVDDGLRGKADLVGGVIPASQLPSFVDDVLEGRLKDGQFYPAIYNPDNPDYFPDVRPYTPERNKVYIETQYKVCYYWDGSAYQALGGGGGTQVQSDWSEADINAPAYIKHKPALAAVATTGSYNDLADKPSMSVVDSLTSTSTTDALSANQGKVLKGLVDGKAEEFIVNVSYNGSAYSADKTPEECCAAFNGGKRVIFQSMTPLPNDGGSQTYVATSVTASSSTGSYSVYAVGSVNDNGVSVLKYQKSTITGTMLSMTNYDLRVVNNLTSTSTTSSLSAAQGKALNDGKQDKLVSGTSIKTINSQSVLGSGNIAVATPADLATYCPIIEDTRENNTQTLTGNAPFATLNDGQRIILSDLKFTLVYSPTLNLTLSNGAQTGAIPMYCDYSGGSTLKTNWGGLVHVGASIALIFDATNSRWICLSPLDTNTTYATLTQSEIDAGTSTTAKVVFAKLLCDNFQKHTAIVTMPSGAIAPTGGYEPNKMYDFGKVSSVTFATYDTSKEIANAVNLYMCTFVVASGGTTLTLNANIKYPNGDDGTELTNLLTTEDRVFEITIRDNKLSYLYFD